MTRTETLMQLNSDPEKKVTNSATDPSAGLDVTADDLASVSTKHAIGNIVSSVTGAK
jgi:hypothetical protein